MVTHGNNVVNRKHIGKYIIYNLYCICIYLYVSAKRLKLHANCIIILWYVVYYYCHYIVIHVWRQGELVSLVIQSYLLLILPYNYCGVCDGRWVYSCCLPRSERVTNFLLRIPIRPIRARLCVCVVVFYDFFQTSP